MGRFRRHNPPTASFSDSEPEEISMDSSDRDPDEIFDRISNDLDDVRVDVDPPLPKTREELEAYVENLKKNDMDQNQSKIDKWIQNFFILTIASKILYTIWTLAHTSSFSVFKTSDFFLMFFLTVLMWLSTAVNFGIVSQFKKNKNRQLLHLSLSGLVECDEKLRRLLLAKICILFVTFFILLWGIHGGSVLTPFEFILPLYLYVFTYGGVSFLIGLVWLQYQIRTDQSTIDTTSTTSTSDSEKI